MYSDGSYFHETDVGVSACLIFNSDDTFKEFKFKNTGYCSIYYELLPIVIGLEMICSKNTFLVSIRTDCQSILHIAKGLRLYGYDQFVEKKDYGCKDLIKRFDEQLKTKPARLLHAGRAHRYIRQCHNVCREYYFSSRSLNEAQAEPSFSNHDQRLIKNKINNPIYKIWKVIKCNIFFQKLNLDMITSIPLSGKTLIPTRMQHHQ